MVTKRTKAPNPSADPGQLGRETWEWLTHNTIPNLREIALDLENTGEDLLPFTHPTEAEGRRPR